MGRGSLALSAIGASGFLESCASVGTSSKIPKLPFSSKDALGLVPGLNARILASWGDALNDKGVTFGFNNDYLALFPLEGSEALLCVNHETPHPGFVGGRWGMDQKSKTKSQVEAEMRSVGVSVVHVAQSAPGLWEVKKNSPYNRRIDGLTPIPFVTERAIMNARQAIGTLGNCAGGFTPWGSYLTCEENYDNFYGEAKYEGGKRTIVTKDTADSLYWFNHFDYPSEHYGWVVEIDPRTGEAKKLTALGRFAHECATVRPTADGRCVVYTADDAAGEHLYKFIAEKPGSLERGTLYVADTVNGKWLPLKREANPRLKKAFKDQTEVLIRAREAAKLVGATPLDRPEDVEICPKTGDVFVALTNNVGAGNLHGSLFRLSEKGGDPFALEFTSSTYLAGGSKNGFSCPDNMVFDKRGNLWLTSDITGSKMNKGDYKEFGNNGLFYIPMEGTAAGIAHLFATAPTDAEFTGPMFSPDGRTLFLSVQHPGELTKDPQAPTSSWPTGAVPKPSVVCLSGALLDRLMGLT